MDEKKIIILMSTYNGEKYLEEQLHSLYQQRGSNISVLVRDDGSEDDTIQILESWKKNTHGWLTWIKGENIGPCRSFLELLKQVPDADYYAYCDQDDFWEEDKVGIAVECLESLHASNCIYTSNVKFTDERLSIMGISNFSDNSSMGRFLIYNQAVGCTMVISHELKNLIIEKYMLDPYKLKMHDCWTYRVCIATGGKAYFDKTPHILYRQHGNNVGGGSASLIKIWKARLQDVTKSKRNKRQYMAKELLRLYSGKMSLNMRSIVRMVAEYDISLKNKWLLICRKDIYSQKWFSDMSIRLAILFNIL